jgi:predicted nuclease of predicted toxin-antitoxin system
VKRLLLDQGLPRSTAILLNQAGWDVILVAEVGMSRSDDLDILQRARGESRICITLDADFHALIATRGERSPSVIRIRREGLNATALATLLQAIWPRVEDALDNGALVTVTKRSVRIRHLPVARP